MWIKPMIGKQRKALIALFEPAMKKLSQMCVVFWSDLDRLDKVLSGHFASIPHCHLVYVVDKLGKQISSNINANCIDHSYCNQDLSKRPYSVAPKRHFMLSSVYISQNTGRPCISALHPVIDDSQQLLGFVVADFDLRQLPLSVSQTTSSPLPEFAPRHKLSPLRRVTSPFDKYTTDLQGILNKLISEHGVFHCVLHYASANAELWQMDDPHQYRLYGIEKLLEPDMYLAYPRYPYPADAKVSRKYVQKVLERFCILRLGDESIYLRAGSLNIMNGIVGLSFSFNGTQYLPAEEFLSKDWSYWFGQAALNSAPYKINEKTSFTMKHSFSKGINNYSLAATH